MRIFAGFLGEGTSNTINVIPASKLSPTIHETRTSAAAEKQRVRCPHGGGG